MHTAPHKISRALLAFAALTLAAGSAHAAAPSYVGTWASDLAQCKVPQERAEAPLILQEKRFDQYETHCTFNSADGAGDEWKVKANCQVEGDAQAYDFTLTVSGDTLTLTDDAGSQDLLRCR
ncbi:hypothetical protein [Hyphomicrobium sp.]|uniref:hypothetical protein n=1 Tax=Hyphomicrobium sp. TaxID=82 RepID=UPI002B7E2EB4|nr:hypothetical protein [Hyphomicrobium sp.]HRN87570.1 hypothetical protein [Hyphomicrobium sp.]HRQ26518.1 hypothetical protein [Hyphomicrobium sp.]